MGYEDEIVAMKPIGLDGDIKKLERLHEE